MADLRAGVLRAHGAGAAEVDELLAYNANSFDRSGLDHATRFPLADEPFVATWERYARDAARSGVFDVLRDGLVQLQFPVESGMSQAADYQAATRRGVRPLDRPPLALTRPGDLRLFVHPTAAGRVPVIVAGNRRDFALLMQALTRKNEPDPIPDSMGACMVAGYNNWDRVQALRRRWEIDHGSDDGWDQEFQRLATRKDLYQDRFILLVRGPYSATPAERLGLTPDDWADRSLTIRLEHECAHYFTRRVFGSMRNALIDEVMADYTGLCAATGRFRADWFLTFLGLEAFPAYRAGGRLENYRGKPPLSAAAFRVLQSIVTAAAGQLERFDTARRDGRLPDLLERAAMLATIAGFTLEELASADATARLFALFKEVSGRLVEPGLALSGDAA